MHNEFLSLSKALNVPLLSEDDIAAVHRLQKQWDHWANRERQHAALRVAEEQQAAFESFIELRAGHLYQLFAYLRHRAHEPGWEQAEGVLLYPRVKRDFAPEFTTHGHRIRALTVNLHQPWRDIERELLAVTASRCA